MFAPNSVYLKDLLDNPEAKQRIDKAMSTYPLYEKRSKETYIPSIVPTREELNKKILNHYKYREIGFETVGRFIDELEIALCEIMPYYNQLFFSADQDYNVLYNVDYKRTIDTTRDLDTTSSMNGSESGNSTLEGTNTNTSKVDGKGTANASASDTINTVKDNTKDGKKTHSDTPQDELSITALNIDKVKYADSVEWAKDNETDITDTTGTNTSSSSSTNEQTTTGNTTTSQTGINSSTSEASTTGTSDETTKTVEETKGNYGQVSAQSLVLRYRETIMNIEQKIIYDKRIKELFMLVC